MHGFLLSVGFYLTLEEGQMEKLFSPTKNNHNQLILVAIINHVELRMLTKQKKEQIQVK